MQNTDILVIGANMAGLAACQYFSKKGISVQVVDPKPFFEWLPNMHEIISGSKSEKLLQFDKRRYLKKLGHDYIEAAVIELNPEKKIVLLSDKQSFHFTKCLLACGGVNQSYGVEGVKEFAISFKSIEDAKKIQAGIKKLKQSEYPGPKPIVIVGGGIEGVEVLGELLKIINKCDNIPVYLIDSKAKLLGGLSDKVHKKIASKLPSWVHLLNKTKVSSLTENTIYLDNGNTLDTCLTIWTGGVTASPALKEWQLAKQSGDWAPVDNYLRHQSYPDIFVAGDACQWIKPLGKQASLAMDMGKTAAANLILSNKKKKLKQYKPLVKPMLITFGNLDCFLVTEKLVASSPNLLLAKEAVYQIGLNAMERKAGLSAVKGRLDRLGHLVSGEQLENIQKTVRKPLKGISVSLVNH